MYKPALNTAIICATLGVIIGAMGAHALRPLLTPELQTSFETAVKYQFYHSFALMLTGILSATFPSSWIKRATWFFLSGIILFSGSIYLLVYLKSTASVGLGGLGILTPIGGVLFIIGWLALLMGVNAKKK